MTPFATGFKQLPDDGDKAFPLSRLMGVRAEDRVISKVWKPARVTDQGSESSCVGHSCWKLLGSEPFVNPAQDSITPSRIYVEARNVDEWQGTDYDGTSIRAGLSVLKSHGLIQAYYHAEGFDDALEYLLKRGEAGGPLVLGIRWPDSMFYPDTRGVIRSVGKGGGGHAVLAYAANWDAHMVTIRNSWGEDWGIDGDCLLSFDDLKMLLSEEGSACAAVVEA
jgi:hypothetical protein